MNWRAPGTGSRGASVFMAEPAPIFQNPVGTRRLGRRNRAAHRCFETQFVFGNSVFDGVAVSDVEVEYRGLAVKGIGMEVKRRMNYEITGLALP